MVVDNLIFSSDGLYFQANRRPVQISLPISASIPTQLTPATNFFVKDQWIYRELSAKLRHEAFKATTN
jgi:hypothetical protein